MHSSLFFRLFPPPKFMVMEHAGFHLSDDSIFCLQFGHSSHGRTIKKFGRADVPSGAIEEGEIKDEKSVRALLMTFDRAHELNYVKVAVPEEKAYLFQTDVPSADMRTIVQNVEFKLEENVPLPARDAIFYFDLLPASVIGGALRASVSVVPRAYIERYIALLRDTGIFPVGFEVLPKAIARAVIPPNSSGAQMIVYIMNAKTGIYIVSGGVVCFTATSPWGSKATRSESDSLVSNISKEINRIYSYWGAHGGASTAIDRIYLVGREAPLFEGEIRVAAAEENMTVVVSDVWRNAIDLAHYIPPINRDESLDYAVSAGLALDM